MPQVKVIASGPVGQAGPVVLWSWMALPAPKVVQIDVGLQAESFSTGWNRALARMPHIGHQEIRMGIDPPRVVTIPIRRPLVRVRSFHFPAPLEGEDGVVAEGTEGGQQHPLVGGNVGTRIAPPPDLIKLEDRLHYLLQPPLEALLASHSLGFPRRPFPYQLTGIAFLYPRFGAVLADEMGLGKTMQAVTAARLLVHAGEVRSVLLVCPKPLVANWQCEFALWAPELPVAVIEGDQTRRRWQWGLDIPVKIANYEILQRDREVFETDAAGRPVHFDLVILDEAQRIKNRASTTSQVVCAIGRRRSWALTGTPVENSSEDLVGVFEFVAPGFLSPQMKPTRMGQTVCGYILRRTKEEVLTELPPKLIRDAPVELTPEQRASYDLAQNAGVLRLAEMGRSATIQHVFELVLRLKQICNFDPATGASAKLERLEADLEEVAASGRKALVFSQWVETLSELGRRLRRFGPLEYHGRVSPSRREEIVRRFREDRHCHVLLMSYGAGSVGLNLQFAHYVFLFDRWWNPAVEDQAINRVHRIGTDGPVTVTRFLAADTIEERIEAILAQKRELFETILSRAEGGRKLGLSEAELFGLFNLQVPGTEAPAAA